MGHLLWIYALPAVISQVIASVYNIVDRVFIGRGVGALAIAGLVIGLTLTFVHIMGIPLTGTSVNPARSIGPALFQGGDALKQLWIFILGPLAGGAFAAGVWKCLSSECKKSE